MTEQTKSQPAEDRREVSEYLNRTDEEPEGGPTDDR